MYTYTKEIGIRDIYKHYTDKCNKLECNKLEYKQFTAILKDFNILLRDKILSNETVKLPYNLGYLGITKFEVNYDPKKQHKWKIDFKKTKELGYKVYYHSEFGYRWRWYKGRLTGKRYYHFKPCRFASRSITTQLNNGVDYYTKNNINL